MRETIARVCNTILALRHRFMFIHDTSIIYCYEASLAYSIKDMLRPDVIDHITEETRSKLELLS
jgi:exosome complex component RRP4